MVCKYQLRCSRPQFHVLSKLLEWERYNNCKNWTIINFTSDGYVLVTFKSNIKRSFKFLELLKTQLFPALDEPLWRRIAEETAPLQLHALTFFWSYVNKKNGTFATPICRDEATQHYDEVDFFFKPRSRIGKRQIGGRPIMPIQLFNDTKLMQHQMLSLNAFDKGYKPIKMPWINNLPNELKFKILSKIVREPVFWSPNTSGVDHIVNLRQLLPLRGVNQQWTLLVEAWIRQTKQTISSLNFVRAEFQKNGNCDIQMPKSHVRMRVNDSFFVRCFSLTNINNLNIYFDSRLNIQSQLDRLEKMLVLDGRLKHLGIYIEAKGTDFKVNDEVKAMFKRWKKQSDMEAIRLTISTSSSTEKVYSY